ncbi:IS30 family transposase [Hirschia litorea]|uniref:IS30 family transposase n=1 Tax=Hirschia litorea TaxID=1199156 RepID=A0ABW2IKP6_9PROT
MERYSMTHSELSISERRELASLKHRHIPISQIANRLGRHRSTIYREIDRNSFQDKDMPDYDGYHCVLAHAKAQDRRKKQRKLIQIPKLLVAVIEQLKTGWTPEQIAGRLKHENAPHQVSHETIYAYVYSDEGHALSLAQYLPMRRKKRRPRYSRRSKNYIFPLERSIKQRPPSIQSRVDFGDWEGDLMIFQKILGQTNIAAIVERKTRYAVLLKNDDRKSKPLMKKLVNVFSHLPFKARKSITFDRGFEFVAWRYLEAEMDTQSWFCDPSAPWQKGSVENFNKRARRYLPRDLDLHALPYSSLREINQKMNDTPRKCLGYRTPQEVFREELMKLQ